MQPHLLLLRLGEVVPFLIGNPELLPRRISSAFLIYTGDSSVANT